MRGQIAAAGTAQRGVALVIVIWFLAGLSILVAASVSLSRTDTWMAQLHVARAKVAAAGDGAIQLALAQGASSRKGKPEASVIQVGDLRAEVSLVPVSRFLNMNDAKPAALEKLFKEIGGSQTHSPEQLARAVVEWRKSPRKAGGGLFYSTEDLLRVDGVTRTVVDNIRDLVVVGSWAAGSGDGGASRVYRADAVVKYGDARWLRRRWVRMGGSAHSNLPWRFVRTEAPRVLAGK